MKPRISMITLGVENLEKSVTFYHKGLGFPKIDSPPSVAFFNLNGTWLGLYGRKDLAKDANVSADSHGFNNFTLSHNLETEKEVDKIFNEALLAGATAVKKPQKVFWGGYSGYFKDLDEHLWEVAHNPFMWVGPRD